MSAISNELITQNYFCTHHDVFCLIVRKQQWFFYSQYTIHVDRIAHTLMVFTCQNLVAVARMKMKKNITKKTTNKNPQKTHTKAQPKNNNHTTKNKQPPQPNGPAMRIDPTLLAHQASATSLGYISQTLINKK